MIRITSGIAKNRKLETPDIEGFRPVQDVMKLAIFSIIGDKISNAACLDLYAGAGSLGIEALSRGAKTCEFVDENRKAALTIMKNIKSSFPNDIEMLTNTIVHHDNAVKFAANTLNKFDIIFVDPFYHDQKHKFLFQNLEEILLDDGIIIFCHGKELDVKEQIQNTDLSIQTQRKFGNSRFTILT